MRQQQKSGQQGVQKVVVAAVAVAYLLPEEVKRHTWSKPFTNGSVRAVFYVEEQPIQNSYRVLVANKGYKPGERQWFDADDIPNAIKSLMEAQRAHKKAKRYLEGGILRRLIRALF